MTRDLRSLLSDALLNALESERGEKALRKTIRTILLEASQDTALMLQFLESVRSADFVRQNVPIHLGKSHGQLRKDAIQAAPADGLFMEFGVWKGFWITEMSRMRSEVRFY